ncbi:Transcriptional regulator, LysR family [hydrothermal vent metagenome]|uniref:Transcriptional regulator, LysR family n=1 Tax=hydrothermal vent metagenome TaxID=652676 RepID=A0A3B0XXD2_9ZZZZ
MDTLTCMKAFCSVTETGGFSSAARKTGLSKNLLSKYVAHLENSLNTRLLNRTTRHVSTTPAGRAYYERCKPILSELDELKSLMLDTRSQPMGELRITAPISFAELHMMPIIARLSQQYSELEISLHLSDRMVDIVDMGFDVAIRIGELPDTSLVARKIAPAPTRVCASPAYIERHGCPQTPQELQQHPCIFDANITTKKQWQYQHNNQKHRVKLNGSISVNSVRAVKELVLTDIGIGLCPDFMVHNDIKKGRLQALLNDYSFYHLNLYALYPHRRHLSGKIRIFIDALLEHFNQEKPL